MAAASAAVCKQQNNIHALTEVDISKPRAYIQNHRERTEERLSLTAFVVRCLAKTLSDRVYWGHLTGQTLGFNSKRIRENRI